MTLSRSRAGQAFSRVAGATGRARSGARGKLAGSAGRARARLGARGLLRRLRKGAGATGREGHRFGGAGVADEAEDACRREGLPGRWSIAGWVSIAK
jgi:hypothetical protein